MHQKNNSSGNLSSKNTIYTTKENDNSLETKHKVMEYCYLTDRVFKISVMKKLSELQEKLEGRLMSSGIKLETLKKRTKQKFWSWKSLINELKNAIENIRSKPEVNQTIWKREYREFYR